MKLGTRTRRGLLIGALLLTFLAMNWVDGEPELPRAGAASKRDAPPPARVREAIARAPDAAQQASPRAELDLSRLKRSPTRSAADAFATRSWDPPPKKPPPGARVAPVESPPPPPPQAPPLPFIYVGMLGDGDRTTVFLAGRDKDHAVKPGDVIDGTYRVDQVTPQRVVFTYMPFNQTQSLAIGPP